MQNQKNSLKELLEPEKVKNLNIKLEKKLIIDIGQQDLRTLRNFPSQNYNLNFLVEDENIQFDKKISPLLAACFVGKIEIINLLINNEEINYDMESEPEGIKIILKFLKKKY